MRALLLALALGLVGCGTSALRPSSDALRAAQALPPGFAYPAHDTVRVATYNVENFIDAYDNPYIDNDREDAPDLEAVAEKTRLLADAIRALDVDVLSIQEIEDEQQLKLLADSLLPDMGYRFFAATESPDWYQNVVVMSRLPLGPLTAFADVWTPVEGQTNDDGSPAVTSLVNNRLFAVEVRARPDYSFTLVAAHLKAGRGERNEGWRLGQIDLLRAYLATLPPDTNVLLAGDLNLLPDSPEYARLTTGDALGFADPMTNLRTIDPEQSYTHPADERSRQLDYILANRPMHGELVLDATQVALPLPPDDLVRLSDHLPVVATILARD